MGPKEENWLRDSMDAYREAQGELAALKAMNREDLAYFLIEITDVLLDLKQSVIDVDSIGARRAMLELHVLRSEMKKFLKDHP